MSDKLLVINPGSTSTKLAVFEDEQEVFSETLRHDPEELKKLGAIVDQLDYRMAIVREALRDNDLQLRDLSAIVCRGGLVRQIPSGTYRVNDALVRDSIKGVSGQHASNLGALIGHELEVESGVPAYIVDPPVVNELSKRAKFSGNPMFERVCVFHALNQKAVARRYAASVGKTYEELNLLVCHMGGGVSVGAHVGGKVVDTEDAVGGEGPFSPERAGTLPVNDIIDLCFKGDMTKDEIKTMITRGSGLLAYTGSNSIRDLIEQAQAGDEKVQDAMEAFYYQVAKEIAAMSIAMNGHADQIILTGGIANSEIVTGKIRDMVNWIAPVTVYPGEDELLALAQGALRVIRGEEEAKEY